MYVYKLYAVYTTYAYMQYISNHTPTIITTHFFLQNQNNSLGYVV